MTDSGSGLLADLPRAEEFIALIQGRIKPKTVRHSISVAETMLSIADKAGISDDQAVAAGLLHDLGKGMNSSELLAAAEEFALPISDSQRAKPKLLHGAVAAAECRRDLGIDDNAVCEAIEWHTTGKPRLGPVGLALYYADYAEPLRTHPQAAEARDILERDGFMAAIRFVARHKFAYIQTRPPVDPMTEAFYLWLHDDGEPA